MKNNIIFWVLGAFAFSSCNHQPVQTKADDKNENVQHQVNQQAQNSIYQLAGPWTDQNNKNVTLNDLQGKVQVMAMVFTHCQAACPRITGDMKSIESKIAASDLNKVGFTLVSFDSERDTSLQLKSFYDKMNLNERWTLLHGSEQQIRELSVLLNVSYKKGSGGIYAHSNIITVLDTAGNIKFQQEGLGADPKEVMATINSLTSSF